MKRIIVIRVTPIGDYITIGFFGDTGESRMQLTLHKDLFPAYIKAGDELVFTNKGVIVDITRKQLR